MKYFKSLRTTEEERIIRAITIGLSILRSEQGLGWIHEEVRKPDKRKIEDKVSRALYRCLEIAQDEIKQKGQGLMGTLFSQLPIQPNPNMSYEDHEEKIPDFSWQILDNTYSIDGFQLPINFYFIIECKRLGSPTSSSWKLNSNYVNHGIVRFIFESHCYGQHMASGAMIGYLEDMTRDDVHKEVDDEIKNVRHSLNPPSTISPLLLSQEGWQENTPSRLSHELERSFPKSPFTLWHFWLDLRDCYPRSQ